MGGLQILPAGRPAARPTGHGVIDIGHGVIDIGHGVSDIGHGVFDIGHWVFDIGHGVIGIGHGVISQIQLTLVVLPPAGRFFIKMTTFRKNTPKFSLLWWYCLRRVVFLKNDHILKKQPQIQLTLVVLSPAGRFFF